MGTWALDLATKTLDRSTGFNQLFGLLPGTTFQLSELATLLSADDGPRLMCTIGRCVETQTHLDIDVRIPGPGEQNRWIELRAELQVDNCGTAVRFTGVAMDATRRRREQEEMHRSALLLRAVLENASGLIYAKDRDGRMLIANPPTLELIGRPWEEVRGRTDAELLQDTAQGIAVMANDRRIMIGGQTEVLEERVDSGTEHTRTWLSTKAPLRDESGEIIGLVGISQDITARKAAENQLLELNETLEARVAERQVRSTGTRRCSARRTRDAGAGLR